MSVSLQNRSVGVGMGHWSPKTRTASTPTSRSSLPVRCAVPVPRRSEINPAPACLVALDSLPQVRTAHGLTGGEVDDHGGL